MSNDEKLKPCPFCGGEARYTVFSSLGYHHVECIKCDVVMDYSHSFAEAVDRWNRRATVPQLKKKASDLLLVIRGDASLWLRSVVRDEQGRIASAYVINGDWVLRRKADKFVAEDYLGNERSDFPHSHIDDAIEIPHDPAWDGNHNTVIQQAQDFYNRHYKD